MLNFSNTTYFMSVPFDKLSTLRKLNKYLAFIFFILFTISFANASPSIEVSVNPAEGMYNDDFMLEIVITGESAGRISNPRFKKSKFFNLQRYSNYIQQRVINGALSFEKTLVYKLIPKSRLKEGKYRTPEGIIKINNTNYRIKQQVLKILPSLSSSQSTNNHKTKIPENQNEFSFVQYLSNEKPFTGEQVNYRLELIAPPNLRNGDLEEFSPSGIWREKIDEKGTRRIVQNVTIHSFSEAWFPLKSGELKIPHRILNAELQVRTRSRSLSNRKSPIDQFFGGILPHVSQFKIINEIIKSNTLTIKPQPLPPKPETTQPYIPVGRHKVKTSIDKKVLNVGDAFTLTIQIYGDGNLRPFILPEVENLSSKIFKRYDEKPITTKSINNNRLIFYKTFQITMIPLKSGILETPTFLIHWFNPKTKEYEKVRTESYNIEISGEDIVTEDAIPEDNNEKDSQSEESSEDDISYRLNSRYGSSVFRSGSSLTLGLALSAILIFLGNSMYLFSSGYIKTIFSRKSSESLPLLDPQKNYTIEEIDQYLKSYISVLISKAVFGLTYNEIKNELASHGFNILESANFIELLEKCEIYKYSGQNKSEKLSGNNIKKIINELKRHDK